MIAVTIIGQLITLALDTWGRITTRKQAREQLSQGEKLRAALAQTDKNTQIYDEIVREANKQIAEDDDAIKGNLSEIDKLIGLLKTEASK